MAPCSSRLSHPRSLCELNQHWLQTLTKPASLLLDVGLSFFGQRMKTFWDLVRPFHAPLTKAARRRLGSNYFAHPEMELPPPYEAVQLEVERRLHGYLHLSREQVTQIVIVGANDGSEIPRLRQSYPRSRFLCFEPSPQWHAELMRNFENTGFVESRKLALSDAPGTATFHELPLAGNGSLLAPDKTFWSQFNKIENNEVSEFEVKVSTLDHEAETLDHIDLLWMDVQGAEGHVLRGGGKTLSRVSSIFMEVALIASPYRGTLLFQDLTTTLENAGFMCVGLGIDGWNYSGNALWIRKDMAERSVAVS